MRACKLRFKIFPIQRLNLFSIALRSCLAVASIRSLVGRLLSSTLCDSCFPSPISHEKCCTVRKKPYEVTGDIHIALGCMFIAGFNYGRCFEYFISTLSKPHNAYMAPRIRQRRGDTPVEDTRKKKEKLNANAIYSGRNACLEHTADYIRT